MTTATEHFCHSQGYAQQFTLLDGRSVEIRNGCVVDAQTRRTLVGSAQTLDWLLANARLTSYDRKWLEEFGGVYAESANTNRTQHEALRCKYG